jgi:hypothetical protein
MRDSAYKPCGWAGDISAFLAILFEEWREALDLHHRRCMNAAAEPSQQRAWQHSFEHLRRQLSVVVQSQPLAKDWTVIFEYELPRERGRRPDLVILAGSLVLVVEFKDYRDPLRAHVDQVAAYARDLARYQQACRGRPVMPMLVPTLRPGTDHRRDSDVCVVSPEALPQVLLQSAADHAGRIDVDDWPAADYAPLPSLVAAARWAVTHAVKAGVRAVQPQSRLEALLLSLPPLPASAATVFVRRWAVGWRL